MSAYLQTPCSFPADYNTPASQVSSHQRGPALKWSVKSFSLGMHILLDTIDFWTLLVTAHSLISKTRAPSWDIFGCQTLLTNSTIGLFSQTTVKSCALSKWYCLTSSPQNQSRMFLCFFVIHTVKNNNVFSLTFFDVLFAIKTLVFSFPDTWHFYKSMLVLCSNPWSHAYVINICHLKISYLFIHPFMGTWIVSKTWPL